MTLSWRVERYHRCTELALSYHCLALFSSLALSLEIWPLLSDEWVVGIKKKTVRFSFSYILNTFKKHPVIFKHMICKI